MAMSHASSERNSPSFRAAAQFLYAGNPPAPSPVPYDIPAKTPEPTIKKRKRKDARQLEALNRMYARTALPSRGERQQLAKQLDMSAESVRIWLVHIFVYMYHS
jgi:homeobox protein YOX1/YHP1